MIFEPYAVIGKNFLGYTVFGDAAGDLPDIGLFQLYREHDGCGLQKESEAGLNRHRIEGNDYGSKKL